MAQAMSSRGPTFYWSKLAAGNSFQPHFHEDMQETFVRLSR